MNITANEALIEDAAFWRRAIRACLSGQTPDSAVECCSHLALKDAEMQIAELLAVLTRLVAWDDRSENLLHNIELQSICDDARAAFGG